MAISDTRIYSIWSNMKRRCRDKNNNHYHNYGGRGITYCEEWEKSTTFIKWAMENGYRDDLTLDRINNDGNYEPDNCRWTTWEVQSSNKVTTVYITYKGITHTIKDWGKITKLPYSTISYRYNRNLPPEEILAPKQRLPRLITYKGKTKSLAEWARDIGISPETLAYRIDSGKPLKEAFQKQIYKKLVIKGVSHTVAEWAEISGISYQLIMTRLKQGKSPEEAVFTPIQR